MPFDQLGTLTSTIRCQAPIILILTSASILAAVLYLATTPASYTADATLMIDSRKLQVLQQQSVLGDIAVDSSAVEGQVEVLKSENIGLAVVKSQHLTQEPEFVKSELGLFGAISRFFTEHFTNNAEVGSDALIRRALETFENNLTIRRIGLTSVIEIDFRSVDPQRAARVANAVADAYIDDQLDAKYEATRRASLWLQDRIRELRDQASTAERAVVDFKKKNNIVDADGHLMSSRQVSEVNTQLNAARVQSADARAKYERIQEILASDVPDGTVTDTLHSEVITKLRSQYLDLANREADLSKRYGSDHLAAVRLRNQMSEINKSIRDELGRIAQTFKSDLEIAQQREKQISDRLNEVVSESQDTNEAQVKMRELDSTAQSYRTLYNTFLQRYTESVQQQSFPISEARLITKAAPPRKKSSPKTLLVLSIATFGGFIVGLGIAMLREFYDRVFRTGGQVEALLGARCLAIVPMIKKSKRAVVADNRRRNPALREADLDGGILSEVVSSPFSGFAEAVRSIKVAADLNCRHSEAKVIALTSTLPNEGKSTLAASLAQLIAHAGAHVILVDSDLRNPSLSRAIAPHTRKGFVEVAFEGIPLTDAIWTDQSTRMDFLPIASQTRLSHTNEILASDATYDMIQRLRQSYDYVIVDMSPLAPVVDVRATSELVDCYVLVVEWGKTSIDAVQRCMHTTDTVRDKLLGVVLNKANTKSIARYEGYGGGYYTRPYSQDGYAAGRP